MSNNYKLKVSDDGRVRYMIRSGKDLVLASTTAESAEWMMKNKPITRETPTDWPEFQVCADGAYWFEGTWDGDEEKSIFDDAAGKHERQPTKSRKRGD